MVLMPLCSNHLSACEAVGVASQSNQTHLDCEPVSRRRTWKKRTTGSGQTRNTFIFFWRLPRSCCSRPHFSPSFLCLGQEDTQIKVSREVPVSSQVDSLRGDLPLADTSCSGTMKCHKLLTFFRTSVPSLAKPFPWYSTGYKSPSAAPSRLRMS